VTITGVIGIPALVALNGEPIKYTYDVGDSIKLYVSNLSINMDTEFTLKWGP
jgi:hypothetical protein